MLLKLASTVLSLINMGSCCVKVKILISEIFLLKLIFSIENHFQTDNDSSDSWHKNWIVKLEILALFKQLSLCLITKCNRMLNFDPRFKKFYNRTDAKQNPFLVKSSFWWVYIFIEISLILIQFKDLLNK